MTKTLTIITVLLVLNWACGDKPNTNTPPQYKAENKADTVHFYSKTELKQLWDTLCQTRRCLAGGQYVWQGKWGGEGCVLTNDKKWISFLSKTDTQQLGLFLIEQLKDKTKTQVHTCPHDVATKGELALYCLQGLLKTNFYDLSDDKALNDKILYKKYGNEQNWIWHIQSTKREIELLQKLWAAKLPPNPKGE